MFGRVALMVVQLNKLNALLFEVLLEGLACHIVKDFERWLEAALGQIIQFFCEHSNQCFVLLIFNRFSEDRICRPIVDDEDGCHVVERSQRAGASGVKINCPMLGIAFPNVSEQVIVFTFTLLCLGEGENPSPS